MSTGPATPFFPLDLGMRNTAEDQPQPFGPSAALVESTNTRLGIIPGVPVGAPEFDSAGGPTSDLAALVPCGQDCTLVICGDGPGRLSSTGVSAALSFADSALHAYTVSGFTEVPGMRTYGAPAVAFDSDGNLWTVSSSEFTSFSSVSVSVRSPEGVLIVTQQIVQSSTTSARLRPWVGITSHGANGMALWWYDGTNIKAATMVLAPSTLSVTVGTAAVLFAGPFNSSLISVHSDDHATRAWLVYRNPASTADAVAWRITVGGAWARINITLGNVAPITSLGLRHITYGGAEYVAVTSNANSTGATRTHLFNGTTMASIFDFTHPLAMSGSVAPGFMLQSGVLRVIAATCVANGIAPPGATVTIRTGTEIKTLDLTGAVVFSEYIPWKILASNIATEREGSTRICPVFALQNAYDLTNSDPTVSTWLDDPAVELWRKTDDLVTTMISRIAVDTAVRYGQFVGSINTVTSNCLAFDATSAQAALAYLEETPGNKAKASVVVYEVGGAAVAPAVDSDGLAIVGCAPASWDGVDTYEWSPTNTPIVFSDPTGGSTSSGWVAGTWRIAAVLQWVDATGQIHRSAPSRVYEITTVLGDKPIFYVTLAGHTHNGSYRQRPEIILYASQSGQSPLFEQPWQPTATDTLGSYETFGNAPQPVQNAFTPGIYTDGSAGFPLPAQCPPSFQATAIVGERMWGLHLGELWPSKPKEAGIAFEFSSELRLPVPVGSGMAFALVEQHGALVVLAERGAWAITGQGPDVSLGGAGFNTPDQISDLPCTSRLAVVRTPAGIFFQSGTRFASLGGELGTGLLEDYAAKPGVNYTAINLSDTKEVVWLSDEAPSFNTRHVVFNYVERKFTQWSAEVADSISSACVDPHTGMVLAICPLIGLFRMDPGSVGFSTLQFVTGDIRLGEGDEADNALQHVLLSAKRLHPHTVQVTLQQDYGAALSRDEAFTEQQILDSSNLSAEINSKRYTLCVEPAAGGAMRAIKATITIEPTGDTPPEGSPPEGPDCVRPYGVTLVYSPKGGTKSDAVFKPAKR